MFDEFDNDTWYGGGQIYLNPARKFHVGSGYDRHNYISTAQLVSSPYTSQLLVQAKIGGLNLLISAVDDSQPPAGSLNPNFPPNNSAYLNYNAIIQNVTTEINGYLSSIYPIPLAQIGTICILQVAALSTDGNNSITSVNVVEPGNYLTAPAAAQSPVYLRYIDPLCDERLWAEIYSSINQLPFSGSGVQFTVAYTPGNFSDESGQIIQTSSVLQAPAIVSGGKNYRLNELLVLTGGSSIVPAKIRQAMLDLVYFELYKRRLAPDEKNPGTEQAKFWRGFLKEIGEGEKQLDGTFKRFFSPVQSWNTRSVLYGANSL